MHQNCKLQALLPCFLLSVLCLVQTGNAQVVAGIRVNGRVLLKGDTINICRGNTIRYENFAQGSTNITWRFKSGTPATAFGVGPFVVTYNINGYDTTFQKIVGGAFSDSTFVIVHVSDIHSVVGYNFTPDNVCANENIHFSNLSSTGEPLSYLWNFGDGNTSTTKDPDHEFLSITGVPGAQTVPVKLVVTNVHGCKDSITKTVTIKKSPDASIGKGGTDASIIFDQATRTFKKCNNIPFFPFQFVNLSSTLASNVSYTIQWGDGSPDSVFTTWPAGQIITHIFPLGSSTMTINVTGPAPDNCIGIKKYTVYLGSGPGGGLTGLGSYEFCLSDSATFKIDLEGIPPNPQGTTYTFFVNDGSPAEVFIHPPPNFVGHRFRGGSCGVVSSNGITNFPNSFGAYLTIQNPCGTAGNAVVPIHVSEKPRASFALPTPVTCINSAITVTNTSSFGNVATATSCTSSGKRVWAISPATGYTIVTGNTGSLNGNTTNGVLWTDGTNGLNIQFTATGTYSIKLYAYNETCGLDSVTRTVCVRNPPEASFTLNQHTSCRPMAMTLNNTSPVSLCQGDDYLWTITYTDPERCAPVAGAAFAFTNGSTNASPSPSVFFNKSGRYVIQLRVRATNAVTGCAESIITDTFFVKAPPVATVAPLASICVNNSVTPVASVVNCYAPGPFGYQWNFGNATPASSTNLIPGDVLYTTTGPQQLQFIVIDSSCMSSDTVNTIVNVIPAPTANAGRDTAVCSGERALLGAAPVTGLTYQWNPIAGLSNAAIANPTAILNYTGPANDTVYTFNLTTSFGNNCSNVDAINITVKRKPIVTINPAAIQICIGTSTSLTAEGADGYLWAPAATLNNVTAPTVVASPTITTVYTVRGTLTNGCFADERATVTVNPDTRAQFLAPDTFKCAPVNINTLITTVPFPQGNSTYNWYANNVLISSSASATPPSYVIPNPGQTVIIKLVTLSAAGCKADSMQKTFLTVPSVTAAFTKDRDSTCAPLTVSFTNTSTDLVNANFIWVFGNGTTSTGVQPGPVTYNANPFFRDSVYQVVLKAFNGCDTSYFRDSITVYADSKARFALDTTRGCSPFTAFIKNTSLGNNFAYYWDFGDGSTDTTHSLTSFTHNYNTGSITTYTIRLISENRCRRDTQLINIVVSPNQIQPFIAANGNQLSGCAPHAVTFNNSTIGAALLTWNFGDNSAPVIIANSQGSINHLYTQAGNYTVTIRLQNDCSDTTIQRTITVFTKPVAAFTTNQSRVCTGQPLTFTNNSTNSNSQLWFWGDGTSSSFSNGPHTYNTAGMYDVMLIATRVHPGGFICTDTIIKQVTVTDKIPAQIEVGQERYCAPYALKVNAGNITGYSLIEWIFYDSSTTQGIFHLTGASATHIYNKAGTYSAKLIVHTTPGCTDTATYNFEVFPSPRITFQPQQISTCNHDTTVTYTAAITYNGTDPVNFKWFINNSIQGTNNPFTYRFQAALNQTYPETFIIKALAENTSGCGDTSASTKLIIHSLPNPLIQVSPSVIQYQPNYTFTFRDSAATNPHKTYVWDMGDRLLQNRNGREITYQYGDIGTYKVHLKVADYTTGCKGQDSVTVTILYVAGAMYIPNAFYPNSRQNELKTFKPIAIGLEKYHLQIFDAWGKLVFETKELNADGSPKVAWEGTFNNSNALPQDAYVWKIVEATFKNGKKWEGMSYNGSPPKRIGTITLFR